MNELAVLTFGYFAGSVPFALLLTRRRGIDLRQEGSGNVGATNVLRTSGVPHALLALSLDAAKGAIAVLVGQRLSIEPVAPVAGGLASIVGHIYPVWLGFRGGKGVATAGGVFVVLSPPAVAIAVVAFASVVWMTRYVSAGSIVAAVTLAVAAAALDASAPVVSGAVITAVVIILSHRGNLARLFAGTERRVGERLT